MVLLLWTIHVISVVCLLCFCARLFIVALWSPAGKGLTSWLSFVMSNFPIGILGQVWYLIVSILDLCPLSYFEPAWNGLYPPYGGLKSLAFFGSGDV